MFILLMQYQTKKREHVMHWNIVEAQQNGFVTDLKPGDKVRVDDTSFFKKGTESSDVSNMPWGCLQFCVAAVSQKLLPYHIIAF